MKFEFSGQMSRLKKKLLLYFLLISIVSISISAEIILEVSSSQFRNEIKKNIHTAMEHSVPPKKIKQVKEQIDSSEIFNPIFKLRNRMILLLLVVSVSIIISFLLFTKDIVAPMDSIVEATKKMVNGDLTVSVPVMTEDEIGLIASLINDMNENLTDVISEVKNEINHHKKKITEMNELINEIIHKPDINKIIKNKKIKISDYKKIIKHCNNVSISLRTLFNDFSEFQNFLNMYKTYKMKSDITQSEIDTAFSGYEDLNNISNNG